MVSYLLRRLVWTIPNLIAVSVVAFIIIQLPPGDWATAYAASLRATGEELSPTEIQDLRSRYGLDDPMPVQYMKWMSGVVTGDFGRSFQWNAAVSEIVPSRLQLTLIVSISTLLITWVIAFPIGIYSAVRQHSLGDYIATFIGFIGLAVPNFLLALIMLYIGLKVFGVTLTGLFSPEYADAPWSMGKVVDMLSRLWIPVLILGTSGTAGLIRVMRANLLDELKKPYVITARAKGLPEWRVIMTYPVRVALNPFISTVGWVLPGLVSGTVIVAIVLNLPTTGPMLLNALQSQDMYLAATFVLMLSLLTVVGTLVSDILLAWLDPRIRYR
ncbi:MAG: ABC transporter permease [Anaerolineaceae bacterium]|nr:ABC transporter permease [Anaerolineaceae bacterium]